MIRDDYEQQQVWVTMSWAELTANSAWVHAGKDPDEEEDDLKPSKPERNRRDHIPGDAQDDE
jgi:hypothetical protein